jgi:peptidoglycan/LPS O-acetylase OafA/YrhL
MRLGDQSLTAEANNFTLVRLTLASLVIYTHSYWLVTGIVERDDLSGLLGAPISTFAVDGFFFLSGFLVYPSLLRLRSASRFLSARAARLWPGLMVSLLVVVAGGAFVTEAHGLAYLRGETAKFLIYNASFVTAAFGLTGVNCGAQTCTVNGSLWTLPWEARCYVALTLLSLMGLARPEMMKRVVLPLTAAGALAWHIPGVESFVHSVAGSGLVYYLKMADRLWPMFALGAGAYLFRDRIPLSWLILAALFLAMLGATALGLGFHVRTLFVGYMVLCFGVLSAKNGAISGRWHDYSYGMYIYAFPVMMAVHAFTPTWSYWALSLGTFAGTLPLAALSWHFIEKPVLDMVKANRARRAAANAIPAT